MEKKAPYGYARMPRVIRKGYKNLTKLQKLLYIYLRDLCGESGMCYRSLRTLADETDFSTGYLSENIPLLAGVGLILAEKKKHNGKKWEIWHITIVDIWEENDKFIQAEKCSPNEQISPPEGVQEMNCSHDEQIDPQKCSPDEPNTPKVFTPALQVRSNITENPNYLNKKESTSSQTSQFTSQEKQIYDNYCLCFKKDMPRAPLPNATEKLIRDIAALATGINTQEEMQSLFAYAKARIRGDNPRVYPANLLYWIDAWKVEWQAQTFALPGPTETPEPAQAVYREHASLPMDMQMWMIDTVKEFGATDLEAECVQGLEWCYQHTTCSEDAFYEKMLQAYATCVKERKDLLFCLCQELGIDSNSNSKQMLTTAS